MKTNLHLAILLLFSAICHSQVGVNTINPKGTLHVDGAGDNSPSGILTASQTSNDMVVTPTGSIGVGTSTPDTSAILDLNVSGLTVGNKKGFLAPRVELTGITDEFTISKPENALMVFNTTAAGVAPNNVVPGYYYWNEAAKKWIKFSGDTEPWQVQGSTAPASANTQNIYQTGSVAVGVNAIPAAEVTATDPKLYVAGNITATGKFYTTNSVYADYVFEKYFQGESQINPDYEFPSLNDVRHFIKANNHLPGVASIKSLNKVDSGYAFDMTKLTIQSLEKIEELYLHTIEQKDAIDAQQVEIAQLKKEAEETKTRLERLEKLLLKKK